MNTPSLTTLPRPAALGAPPPTPLRRPHGSPGGCAAQEVTLPRPAAADKPALPTSANGAVAQEVGPTVGAPVGPVDGLTMGKPVELAKGLSVGESVGAVGWKRGAQRREAMPRR